MNAAIEEKRSIKQKGKNLTQNSTKSRTTKKQALENESEDDESKSDYEDGSSGHEDGQIVVPSNVAQKIEDLVENEFYLVVYIRLKLQEEIE